MTQFHKEARHPLPTKEQPAAILPPSPDSPLTGTAAELAHLLFDQDERARIHGTWRTLVADSSLRYGPCHSPTESTARSYARLHLANSMVDSPEELARDPRRLASLHEWAGIVDGGLGTLAGIHYNLFLGSLLDHDADSRRSLSEFTSMQRTGTFLCTELEHGNDAWALQTTAVYDCVNDGFILNTPTPGAQKFMPNTSMVGGPKAALVAARLLVDGRDQGVFLFLTPLSDDSGPLPGIRVRPLPQRVGSTPVDHCLTAFDQVWLPRHALLEAPHGRLGDGKDLSSTAGSRRKRFLRSIGRVTTGKLCMSGAAVGVSRAALAIAVRYAHTRRIGGPRSGERIPLAAHRSHHGPLVQGLATAYAMTFLHRSVASRWAQRVQAGGAAKDTEDTERLVSVAKAWITWEARAITVECRERCGAQGLFPVNGLAEFPANLEGAITAEGDNLVIWLKAASEMLFGHEAERQAPSGVLPGSAPEQFLRDTRVLRDLLARVEGIWQTRARRALRQAPPGNPIGRWNAASPAAVEMVSAHARLQAADAFLAACERAADPRARSLLEQLCRLFLLQQITRHSGDLLAEGHLHAPHVLVLPEVIGAVIGELTPHMTTLVDAFDLPQEYLADIPIADGGYVDRVVSDVPAARPLASADRV
ncbi:acyl-CoA dehydrogenase [Streptomyces sp. NPDC060322]|uniref:acyl-CoA dehydrogenase family protein n=1 Tax=unclassified Streptomyces TaxID=2593676 RepID=UPI003663E85B